MLQSRGFLNSDPSEFDSTKTDVLREVLRFHEWRYSVKNDPILSDTEYDSLYHLLRKVEEKNPNWVTIDSPTQRVSSDLSSDFASVKHYSPMLSLDNAYNLEDLQEFDKRLRKQLNLAEDRGLNYVVEPKFDGGTVVLVYENDLLVRAATRGNGVHGDDITANMRVLPSIPLRAAFSKHGWSRVEVRGEALIQKEQFKELNAIREQEGQSILANARNAATGALRMKDPREVKERKVRMFCFQISHVEGAEFNESHYESIKLLNELGFLTPIDAMDRFSSVKSVSDYCLNWEQKRESYSYEIDGMVVKLDNTNLQQQSGNTSHHPRWATAYKFQAKQAATILRDVEYQVGKVGNITPVAKVEPVHLAGVTVSSISLHNAEFISARDLHFGDTVLIERAGDVIPYLVKAFPELRDGSQTPVVFPSHCPFDPSGDLKLTKEEGEAAWRCIGCTCGRQELQRMIFHISKPAMDIDGFGKSLVERFYDLGIIQDISDIYNLDYEMISQLEGLGTRSAEKLRISIEKAKQNPISRLLHSLSIHHLGKRASKIISENIEHVFDLKSWSLEDFTSLKDIGPVVAENVSRYFAQTENILLLKKMEEHGVNLRQTEEDKPLKIDATAKLLNKSILFTGSLQHFTRKEAQELAKKNGAKVISAVSSKLNILVVGEKAGSKLKKAEAIGTVEIITEQEFAELLDLNDSI